MSVTAPPGMLSDESWNSTDAPLIEPLSGGGGGVSPNYRLALIASCGFGIPGNILVMIVLLSSQELRRKPVNLFISHQSFIDLWALILTLLINTIENMDDLEDGWFKTSLCKMFYSKSLMWCVIHGSGYNLTFLTLERYWAVKNPLQYDTAKVRRRLPAVFLLAWVLGMLSMAPKYFSTEIVNGNHCKSYVGISSFEMHFVTTYYYMVSGIIPGVTMMYCYAVIGMSLKKSQSFQSDKKNAPQNDKLKRAQANLFQTCVVLMLMFMVCWTVMTAVAFLTFSIGYFSMHYNPWYHISSILLVLNSGLNPYVYALRYHEFQEQLKKLVCLQKADPIETSKTLSTIA